MDAVNINEVLRVEKSDVSMQRKYDSIATLIDSGLASAVLHPARLQIRHRDACKGSIECREGELQNPAGCECELRERHVLRDTKYIK
eukprot:SAG11_NODE_1288_length_5297_cov_13.005194_1_plen_87_part_00